MQNAKCKMSSIYDVLKLCRNLKHLRRLAQHKKNGNALYLSFTMFLTVLYKKTTLGIIVYIITTIKHAI